MRRFVPERGKIEPRDEIDLAIGLAAGDVRDEIGGGGAEGAGKGERLPVVFGGGAVDPVDGDEDVEVAMAIEETGRGRCGHREGPFCQTGVKQEGRIAGDERLGEQRLLTARGDLIRGKNANQPG